MKKIESIQLSLERGNIKIKTGHIVKSEPFEITMSMTKDDSTFRTWTSYEQFKEMSAMLSEVAKEIDKFFYTDLE